MSDELKRAEQALKDFLEQYPHLKFYQARIDKMFSVLPDSNSRMRLLSGMILENLDKLTAKWQELSNEVQKMEIIAKNLKKE